MEKRVTSKKSKSEDVSASQRQGFHESRRRFLKQVVAVSAGVALEPVLLAEPAAAQSGTFIQAYPRRPGVLQGDTLTLHVSTNAPRFRVDFYRQGINSVGQAKPVFVASSDWRIGQNAASKTCDVDWGWPSYTFGIPTSWKPGVYIAMLVTGDAAGNPTSFPNNTTPDGSTAKALFTVRSTTPGQNASILYKLALTTYHAYNYTGGGSLYRNQRLSNTPPGYKVTLHRPGGGTGGEAGDQVADYYDPSSPRQTFAHWDVPMIAWLERNGYVVDYCTDLDLHEGGDFLSQYRLLLSVGHDEYWSQAMRTNLETFIQGGGNVAFFSGNVCWWRIHFTDNNTAFVCDKRGEADQWWSGARDPENRLIGVSYRNGGGWWSNAREAVGYTVQSMDHWVYAGTSVFNGQIFGGTDRLVGYECDGAAFRRDANGIASPTGVDGTPTEFQILAVGELVGAWQDLPPREAGATSPHAATMGLYTRGGTVFNAATIDWPRVLEKGTVAEDQAIVAQITRNVLNRLSVPPGPLPNAPSSLTAQAASSSQISLSWTDNSSNEEGFQIERSTAAAAFTGIATVAPNVTSYTNSGLAASTSYTYRVRAYNGGGSSGYSNTASATTQAASSGPATFSSTASASPASVAPGVATTIQATLTNTGGSLSDGIVDLEVYSAAGVLAGQQFYTGQNLAAGGSYTYTWLWTAPSTPGNYTVKVGVFGPGWAPLYHWNSNAATVSVVSSPAPAPAAPSSLTAQAASSSQISLSWTDNSSNEEGFQIERSTAAAAFTGIATVGANIRSYWDQGLAASTSYSYRVRAYNGSGNSGYSNTSSATTSAATTATFTLSASPSSQTVVLKRSTTYTVTVSAEPGFNGTVGLSVTGLPRGASASFNPPSITGGGSSTMTVSTSNKTPAGTYLLTITGSIGNIQKITQVSLTVMG